MSVKLSIAIIILFNTLTYASVYEKNCITCHKKIPVSIDKYFYRYLLKYSSEVEVKKAIKNYLQNPTQEKTVMAEAFINRFGIKKKSKLSTNDLDSAINDYWQKYKIFGKLQ